MSNQKPGCIHPGDPEGCVGAFIGFVFVAAVTLGAFLWLPSNLGAW